MIIIRRPNPLPGIKQFRFMCQRCGCDFIAEREEVQIDFQQSSNWLIVSCKCPFCNQTAATLYKDKEANT